MTMKNRGAYFRAFYETPAQRAVRACAAAVLAWTLQWLLVAAALTLSSSVHAEPVGVDRLAALAALAAACAWLARCLCRRSRIRH